MELFDERNSADSSVWWIWFFSVVGRFKSMEEKILL